MTVPTRSSTAGSSGRVRALLFDLDGTLIDTFRLYLEAYRRALAPLLGRAPSDAEIAARRPTAERGFLLDWVGADQVDACHASMREHYAALHRSLGAGVYDGVHEMLAGLRSAGYPLGIVTGKSRAGWEVTDRELGLGSFAVVVTEDDAAIPKPHPGGLLAAAAALDMPPAEIVYIGDSHGDLRAGRSAGIRVGAALWAKTSPEERAAFLRDAEPLAPEWRFERPADVTRAFAGWC